MFAYNWGTASYDQISDSINKLTSSNGAITYEFALSPAHTHTDSSVKIKIQHNVATYSASHHLYIDYLNVHYNSAGVTNLKNSANEIINPSTEETLLRVAGDDFDNVVVDTSDSANIVITKKQGNNTVSIKTIHII